jgi:hypothetical protein
MRTVNRKASTSTTFADATSGEGILQMASDENGLLLMAFRLYDSEGSLVVDSEGLSSYPDGLTVRCAKGELLLDVPADSSDDVRYCLYNRDGALLTKSDGVRTRIYPLLRMEGVGRNWTPPVASLSPE